MKRVVFLHGVGSSGAAMRPLAEALGLADQAHCPDGPEPCDLGPGRQWFSVRGVTEANRPARVAAALDRFAQTVARFGPTGDTVLVGFSQGSIMSLHAAAAGLPLAGVIAIAGRLAGPVPPHTGWPPVTLLHGNSDHVMPEQVARATEGWLHDAGSDARLTVLPGLGHMIDSRVMGLVADILNPLLR